LHFTYYHLPPAIAFPQVQLETWRALEELVQSGTIRALGVSNFNAQELAMLYESVKMKVSNTANTPQKVK
jgi:diketogulonate reductase-like aldo/keto reductase